MRMGTLKQSDLISKLGFDGGPGDTATLRIEYRSDGKVFDYEVPYAVFKKLVTLKHPGEWWLTVRDNYKFKEVK